MNLLPSTLRILPRGSYPTPVLGRLLFKITDSNHKTRYPKKGVGYEPLGTLRGAGSLHAISHVNKWRRDHHDVKEVPTTVLSSGEQGTAVEN